MYYISFLPCPTAYHESGPTHTAYPGCCHCCQSYCASYIVLQHPTVWQNSISYICTSWCCMGCRAHGRPSRVHLVWTWGSPPCLQDTGCISPGHWSQAFQVGHAWRAAGNLPVSRDLHGFGQPMWVMGTGTHGYGSHFGYPWPLPRPITKRAKVQSIVNIKNY